MKVIIKKTGEIKEVALGYALNYLLPKDLAVIATKKKLEEWKNRKQEEAVAVEEGVLKNRQQAEKLDGKVIELKVKAGKAGKVHGSITRKEIAKELNIMKANIVLEKPIKKVGEYEVGLKFGKIKAKVKIKVEAEEDEKGKAK